MMAGSRPVKVLRPSMHGVMPRAAYLGGMGKQGRQVGSTLQCMCTAWQESFAMVGSRTAWRKGTAMHGEKANSHAHLAMRRGASPVSLWRKSGMVPVSSVRSMSWLHSTLLPSYAAWHAGKS